MDRLNFCIAFLVFVHCGNSKWMVEEVPAEYGNPRCDFDRDCREWSFKEVTSGRMLDRPHSLSTYCRAGRCGYTLWLWCSKEEAEKRECGISDTSPLKDLHPNKHPETRGASNTDPMYIGQSPKLPLNGSPRYVGAGSGQPAYDSPRYVGQESESRPRGIQETPGNSYPKHVLREHRLPSDNNPWYVRGSSVSSMPPSDRVRSPITVPTDRSPRYIVPNEPLISPRTPHRHTEATASQSGRSRCVKLKNKKLIKCSS